ncbi:unnamed protein product [Adineta ricciae]|uniref:B box-type domain-containing protein n=1 Tax=Adineta ricciae TaxID=249248 RepID=A0A813NMY6_ADIRI|nr:unnamed protein product [Adineta ricciae]CAF0865243.1 unnamed protein product [Adineta ricciae]
MASLITPCTICTHKTIGIFRCEGCSKVFCRKHVDDHRNDLRQQLDEIIHEHNQLNQLLTQTENEHQVLFDEVDHWQATAIERIQQVAEKIRADILEQIHSQRGTCAQSLEHLSQQIRKASQDDDYIENDLHSWTTKLRDLKANLTTVSSLLMLHEESNVPLISNVKLSSAEHLTSSNECFIRSVGDVDIEDNGLVAIHGSRKSTDAFVYGKQEYRHGRHTIRFLINKTNPNYVTTFGITSMQSQLSVYGWNSDDQAVGCRHSQPEYLHNQYDMKGETTLEIELNIDCEQRMISYVNQRTTCAKEMNVDLDLCPFPWQLYFYLYNIGDRVRLLNPIRH